MGLWRLPAALFQEAGTLGSGAAGTALEPHTGWKGVGSPRSSGAQVCSGQDLSLKSKPGDKGLSWPQACPSGWSWKLCRVLGHPDLCSSATETEPAGL